MVKIKRFLQKTWQNCQSHKQQQFEVVDAQLNTGDIIAKLGLIEQASPNLSDYLNNFSKQTSPIFKTATIIILTVVRKERTRIVLLEKGIEPRNVNILQDDRFLVIYQNIFASNNSLCLKNIALKHCKSMRDKNRL